MTTEEAVFKGVIYGGAFTLAATVLANCFQVFIQWRQQKWSIVAEMKKSFAEKRLGALQGAVQLCDFLLAAKGRNLGSGAKTDWSRIRSENLTSGGLMPTSVQKDFQVVLTTTLFRDGFDREDAHVDTATVERLRSLCVAAIQEEFEK